MLGIAHVETGFPDATHSSVHFARYPHEGDNRATPSDTSVALPRNSIASDMCA